MARVLKRVTAAVLASSALLLGGGTVAIADDLAVFKECVKAHNTSAGPKGAEVGHFERCIASAAFSG